MADCRLSHHDAESRLSRPSPPSSQAKGRACAASPTGPAAMRTHLMPSLRSQLARLNAWSGMFRFCQWTIRTAPGGNLKMQTQTSPRSPRLRAAARSCCWSSSRQRGLPSGGCCRFSRPGKWPQCRPPWFPVGHNAGEVPSRGAPGAQAPWVVQLVQLHCQLVYCSTGWWHAT